MVNFGASVESRIRFLYMCWGLFWARSFKEDHVIQGRPCRSHVNIFAPRKIGCRCCRGHFHIHFLERKRFHFDSNFNKIHFYGSNWQLLSICLDNDLASNRRQSITWTNGGDDSLVPNVLGHLEVECTMTSSNGNIFRVTGPLCGVFTGPGEFSAQRPVTQSFDVFFDLRLNKRLSKQRWGWWFETLSCLLWRQGNGLPISRPVWLWDQYLKI